ncbi:hypothetical protein TrCOL_g4779 [Triparma columacea]|uniref:Nucleoside phosphorylase domain-containing protein n=1 Tax=Triparma columacea TaxID=722753 RepID=A0A9W7GKR2_9STRA|nr:hypothetical protein TrCOL_g4779 [Triparma columacea]
MEAEAAPTIKKLALQVLPTVFPSALPYQCYTDSTKSLYLVTSGKDATHAVDNVGTMHAALAVSTALMALPDIKVIVNAGTCGGFIKRGCKIGTVVIPTKGAFHDRRIVIPSTPFEQYGIGATDLTSCAIANEVREKLGYLGGCCSSGDSLDHSKEDDEIMEGNEAVVKCMEFAAISQVAKMWGKDLVGVKVVTDLVDGDKPAFEEFMANLSSAAEALQASIPQVLEIIKKEE